MKAVRISLLTMVLLVGATSRPMAPLADTSSRDAATITRTGDGPCYWLNGVWVCEP